jgi:hypothetical protein
MGQDYEADAYGEERAPLRLSDGDSSRVGVVTAEISYLWDNPLGINLSRT